MEYADWSGPRWQVAGVSLSKSHELRAGKEVLKKKLRRKSHNHGYQRRGVETVWAGGNDFFVVLCVYSHPKYVGLLFLCISRHLPRYFLLNILLLLPTL